MRGKGSPSELARPLSHCHRTGRRVCVSVNLDTCQQMESSGETDLVTEVCLLGQLEEASGLSNSCQWANVKVGEVAIARGVNSDRLSRWREPCHFNQQKDREIH